ncbi:MAG: hypothetical protein ACP5P3_07445 [Ignavibacteria bacterium]
MNFNSSTIDLFLKIQDFCGHKLHLINDLMVIFEFAGEPKFKELSFISKYITGLHKIILRKEDFGEDYSRKIRSDFSSAIENLKDQISHTIPESNSYLREKFLSMDMLSFQNLLQLASELSICKEYYNSLGME